jgi:transcriptional regulator with XRE-family HTH domain
MVHPLTEARKRANLSQQALADLIGKDRLTVLRIEKSQTQPPPATVNKIIAALRENNVELSASALRPDLAKTFGDAA